MTRTAGVGLLLLSGCDVARSMRDDLARLGRSPPPPAQTRKDPAAPPAVRPRSTPSATAAAAATTAAPVETPSPVPSPSGDPPIAIAGKSENELRAMFGTPTSEEDRPPGKRWRYRDGQCTLDIQLYPDVQTKQFGTLAYEVKSDDGTDEGKRLCLAQLRSRIQSR